MSNTELERQAKKIRAKGYCAVIRTLDGTVLDKDTLKTTLQASLEAGLVEEDEKHRLYSAGKKEAQGE